VSGATILVVGDVIDDVLVRPLGPIRPDTDTPARITPAPGGSGANAAVWLADAGASVRFVGRVGAADLERHRRALLAAGVEARLVADAERPTGTIVVLVDPAGGRTMLTDRGANLGLRTADLPDTLLDGVGSLHVSGYSLFDPDVRAAVLAFVSRGLARGLTLSVDPSSTGFLGVVGVAAFLGWIEGCDVLLPNADEARLLAGREDLDAAARDLLEVASVVAVTCGADGALVVARTGDHLVVPARTAPIVDSTGAGDAFTGGFLATWRSGGDLRTSVARGVAAGARAVAHAGARPPAR
jgi:sugar/nucleoside kinase (ribokinase family)